MIQAYPLIELRSRYRHRGEDCADVIAVVAGLPQSEVGALIDRLRALVPRLADALAITLGDSVYCAPSSVDAVAAVLACAARDDARQATGPLTGTQERA